MTPELSRLLSAGTAFDAEYGPSIPNHRSTVLLALATLGADGARLAAWAQRYEARLQPAPPAEPWPSGAAWPPRLGDPSAWPAFRDLFGQWLDSESLAELLTPVLPQLVQGCAGAAFHGLNRLAAAVQAGHPADQADALAYWACRWWPVPATARAAAAAEDGTPLAALAQRAADAYARTGHRVALQLVTSAHALRVLLPFLDADSDEPAAALRAYRLAFDCAWRAMPRPAGKPPAALAWPDIVALAVTAQDASNDADTLELVAACCAHHTADGHAIWAVAATRALAQRI